jgi:hypothetical protein
MTVERQREAEPGRIVAARRAPNSSVVEGLTGPLGADSEDALVGYGAGVPPADESTVVT